MIPKITILAIACAVGMAGLFGPGGQPSSGQQNPPTSRKPACGCYVCGKLDAVEFPDKGDCAGILAEDACTRSLGSMPPEKREGFCQKIKAKLNFTSFKDSCPAFAACEPGGPTGEKPPPEKKCEKPTPWFGSSPTCTEVQSPVVAINTGAVTLTICGYPVFRHVPEDKDPTYVEAYKRAVEDWVKARVGSKICCDTLREAARTGTPCYPGFDIDCDGKPNQADVDSTSKEPFPDINNLFSKPEGAPIAPFPAGLDPDDPDFLPPQDKCDCKWELVKGTVNCSPDGKQRHFYQAHWRCPSTGNERFTRKYAAATAPCP